MTSQASPSAFRASNGELAWRRDDIEAALTSLAAEGRAILGGEVWLITGPNSWHGLIPQRDGSPPAVYSWETPPRSSAESWSAYCQRTARESVAAVGEIHVEQETLPELIDRLRFNVTLSSSNRPNQSLEPTAGRRDEQM